MRTIALLSGSILLAFSAFAIAQPQTGKPSRNVSPLVIEQQKSTSGLAAFFCETGSRQYLCEARNWSQSYTYAWSTDGAVYLPQSCHNEPYCVVNCWGSSGGSITLTVTNTSTGFSDTRTRYLQCGAYSMY
jgi:hypothetical protein